MKELADRLEEGIQEEVGRLMERITGGGPGLRPIETREDFLIVSKQLGNNGRRFNELRTPDPDPPDQEVLTNLLKDEPLEESEGISKESEGIPKAA